MEKRRGRSRAMAIIVTLFVLAVLVAGGTLGYFWYRKAHPTTEDTSNSSGGTVSLSTTPKLETETFQTVMLIPASTDKVGDSVKLSVMSMTTPKSWRTVNGKTLLNTPVDNVYATTTNDILTQLIMVPETNPTDPIQATNSFGVYNVTTWLKKPTQTTAGTVTAAAKAAYIQNIANIGDGKTTDKTVCAKGYGVLNSAICGNLISVQPISTTDGALKGVAFLNATASQAVTYDPTALVFLTGKVKDQQLFAYGAFHLLDNNSHQLSATDTAAVKAAWDSLLSGQVPSDTTALYQHVVDAIKSITIQAN